MEFLPFGLMAFAGWLAGGGHQMIVPVVTNLLSGVFGQRQKKAEAQATIAAKQTITGDVAFERIFERMERLEARVDGLERVKNAYDNVTRQIRQLAQQIRRGQRDDSLLEELERIPSSVELMK